MKRKTNPQQEKKYDIEEYRRKQKRKKFLHRLLRFLIVLLLLGGTAAGIYFYDKYDLSGLWNAAQNTSPSTEQATTLQTGSFPVSLDATKPMGLEGFADGILLLTEDESIVLGKDGSVSSQFVHGYTNPVIRTGDSRYLLYDRGGYGYRIQNQVGTIIDGRTTETILGGACGHKSAFALVTSESRYAGNITVYGKNGGQLFSWYSPEQVVDLAFSPNDRYLAVTTIVFENTGTLNARVYLFDVEKEEEVTSADFSDALPLAVNVLEDGTVHLVTDSFLGILSADFTEQSKIPYLQSLRKYQFSHTHTLLVTSNANEVSSTVLLVSEDGEKTEQDIRNSVTDISLDEDGLGILAGGSVRTYSLELEMLETSQVSNDVFRILYNEGEIYTMSNGLLDKLSRAVAETSGTAPEGEENEN